MVAPTTNEALNSSGVDGLLTDPFSILEFVNHIPGIVWEVSTDPQLAALGFNYLSEQASTILGYSLDQLSKPAFWAEIVYPEDLVIFRDQRRSILEKGDLGMMHYRVIAGDGRVLTVEAKIQVVRDSTGKPIAMRGVTTDVTERSRSELRWKFMAKASELLGESYDFKETLSHISALLVPELADICLIHLVESDGSLYNISIAARTPEQEAQTRFLLEHFPLDQMPKATLTDVAEKKRSMLLQNIDESLLRELAQNEEHYHALHALNLRSSIIAPLIIQGEVLGTLTLSVTGSGAPFTEADQIFVEELARQAAQAMYKSRLREESRIETDLRLQVQERMEFLAHASAVLARTVDAESALIELSKMIVPQLADVCMILLKEGSGIRPLVLQTDPPEILARMREISEKYPRPVDAQFGLAHVLKTGIPDIHLIVDEAVIAERSTNEEHAQMLRNLGMSSMVTYPLEAHGEMYGALVMGFTSASGRVFHVGDLGFVEEIALRTALCIYKARLLEEARSEVDRRRQLQERMEILEQISRAMSMSKDVATILRSIGPVLAPKFSDWLIIDLENEAGMLHRPLLYHSEPSLREAAEEFRTAFQHDPTSIVQEVLRSGTPVVLHGLEDINALEVPIEKRGHTVVLGRRSALIVPLNSRGRTRGVLSLIYGHSERNYREADIDFAMEIASRLATGLETARLFSETERQMAELQSIYHTSPIGLALVDRELRFVRVNETLAELNGIPWHEQIGKSVLDVLGDLGPQTASILASVFSTGKPVRDLEMRGRLPSNPGTVFVATNSFYPVRSASGEIVAVSVSVVDITDRKLSEIKLQEAKEEAEVASRAKDQFIAALSHELRTPLTPVLATVDLLDTEPEFPENYRPFLDLIRRNIEIEARLIDDLLDMTRIAKGKFNMSIAEIDLHQLLPRVIEICQPELDRNKLRVITRFDADHSILMADAARLQQVFWNLIHNASKYTPLEGSITLRTRNAQNGDLIVEVSDTGRGIDPADLLRIFDPFEQDAQARFGTMGGLGLGLAISRNIVELHHGTIEAHSEGPGTGATFSVRLHTIRPEVAQVPAKPKPGKSSARRILLVDDHIDTNVALKMLLERRGYVVTTAATASAGLQLATTSEFDLLVSDIGLPDGNGLDLLRDIRKQCDLKAISVSGYGTDADFDKSIAAGFQRHLKKPITFPELERAIAELLQ